MGNILFVMELSLSFLDEQTCQPLWNCMRNCIILRENLFNLIEMKPVVTLLACLDKIIVRKHKNNQGHEQSIMHKKYYGWF